MFGNVGMGEYIVFAVLALLTGVIPLVLAIWVVVTLARIRHGVERIADAVERSAESGRRVP